MSSASITTTARVSRDAISVTTTSGRERIFGAACEFSITYVPGNEDDAIETVEASARDLISRINAARPAAASTQQEGTTP